MHTVRQHHQRITQGEAMTDWQSLGLWALGCAQGIFVGWYIWRKPALKYKPEDE
jgi:hypothetical protein